MKIREVLDARYGKDFVDQVYAFRTNPNPINIDTKQQKTASQISAEIAANAPEAERKYKEQVAKL